MALTGPQSQKLRDAILNGFTGNDLEQMILFEMNVHLRNVIPEGPLATVAFNLVSWCDAQGRIGELLDAIEKARPKNQAIQKAVAELRAELGLQPPTGVSPPPAKPPTLPVTPPPLAHDGPVLAEVRKLILALYPDLDEFIILFEDTLGQKFESVAGTGKTTTQQVHAVVQWANANRGFRLCPLIAAVTSEHQNSAELTALRQALCPT